MQRGRRDLEEGQDGGGRDRKGEARVLFFGAGRAAFFVPVVARAKRRGFAAAAGPPGVGLGLVRRHMRPF